MSASDASSEENTMAIDERTPARVEADKHNITALRAAGPALDLVGQQAVYDEVVRSIDAGDLDDRLSTAISDAKAAGLPIFAWRELAHYATYVLQYDCADCIAREQALDRGCRVLGSAGAPMHTAGFSSVPVASMEYEYVRSVGSATVHEVQARICTMAEVSITVRAMIRLQGKRLRFGLRELGKAFDVESQLKYGEVADKEGDGGDGGTGDGVAKREGVAFEDGEDEQATKEDL